MLKQNGFEFLTGLINTALPPDILQITEYVGLGEVFRRPFGSSPKPPESSRKMLPQMICDLIWFWKLPAAESPGLPRWFVRVLYYP